MAWVAEPLPPETVAAVRQAVGPLVERVMSAVRAENPVYAPVLGGPEGIGLQLGIEQAIKAFLDAVERGERPGGETAEVWRLLGEAEFQSGRSLDALRAAFRTGIRAAWRGAADVAVQAGIPAAAVVPLAEAIFLYTDELAADVVEGYLRMQSDEAGERARRRRRLANLLAEHEHPDPEAIEHAAELARWELPPLVTAMALRTERPEEVARRLDADVLVGPDYLLVPGPHARESRGGLERALAAAGVPAALGPALPTREAGLSLAWARLALGLVERGRLASPASVDDHLATVILLRDEEMAGALVRSRLAPVLALPDGERERLLETLRAWLEHQRHTPAIAAQLHVHPQTVRYRIARLRELLGEALESPDGRFELELAVRARALIEE